MVAYRSQAVNYMKGKNKTEKGIEADSEYPALVIADIRSAHNVGSLFRTSDGVGIKKIYLTGTTPAPLDRFDRPRKDIAKTALGAELSIPWKYEKGTGALLKKLKSADTCIIAIEQSKDSIDYKKVNSKIGKNKKVVFVVGNEVEGLSPTTLKLVDIVAEIPMKGMKESLNVSVAAGIALFRILEV